MNTTFTSIVATTLLFLNSYAAELPKGEFSVRYWNGAGAFTTLNEHQKQLFIDAYSNSSEVVAKNPGNWRVRMRIPTRFFQIMIEDRVARTVSIAIEGGSFYRHSTDPEGIESLRALCIEHECAQPEMKANKRMQATGTSPVPDP